LCNKWSQRNTKGRGGTHPLKEFLTVIDTAIKKKKKKKKTKKTPIMIADIGSKW